MVGCDQCIGCGPHRQHSAQIIIHNNCTYLMKEPFVRSTRIIKMQLSMASISPMPQYPTAINSCTSHRSKREKRTRRPDNTNSFLQIQPSLFKDFFDEFPKIYDDKALDPVHLHLHNTHNLPFGDHSIGLVVCCSS